MSGLYGADVAQLRQLAQKFDDSAATIDEAASTLNGLVAASHAWQGPDAGDFRGGWPTQHTAMTGAATTLRDAAKRLGANADDQERTSTDGGTFGGGGSAGGAGAGTGGSGGAGAGAGGEGESGWRWWGSGQAGIGEGPETTGTVNTDRYGDDLTLDKGPSVEFEEPTGQDAQVHLAGASAEGGWGLHGETSGEWGSSDGWHAEAEAEGWAGAQGEAGAGVHYDAEGRIVAEAGASVAVGVGGSASATGGYGLLEGSASANAFAGARAGGNAEVSFGPDGLGAQVGAEAFAGAEASASVSGGITGAQVGATGEVYAGIGIKANAEVNFGLDKTSVDIELGAALGIGAGFSIEFDVEPKKIVDGILDVFGF